MQAIINETAPHPHPVGSLFTPIDIDDDVTIEQVTQAMEGFEKSELLDMLALAHLLKNDTNYGSPAEELIGDLLRAYGWFGGCLRIEDVERCTETFRERWAGIVKEANGMAQRYPHLFSVVGSDEAVGSAAAGKRAADAEAKTAESAATSGHEPEPQTMTARLAADAFQACIDRLMSMRHRMLKRQDAPDERATVDDLAGALLLNQILNDWEGGAFADEFPKEHWLLRAIRGNTES